MESGYSGIGEEQYHSRGEHGFHLFPSQNGYTHDFVALSDTHVALALHVSRHAGIDQCLLHSRLPPTQDCIVCAITLHSRSSSDVSLVTVQCVITREVHYLMSLWKRENITRETNHQNCQDLDQMIVASSDNMIR